MDLATIERKARRIMSEHGVGHLEFKWANSKKSIAYCKSVRVQTSDHTHVWIAKSIHLSKLFAPNLTEEEFMDTILHEIAHAKAGHEASHGPKWQRIARELGANPKPCGVTEWSPEKAWKAYCPLCGSQAAAQHRAPLRVYMCGKSDCRRANNVQRVLRWEKNGNPVPVCEMPVRFQTEARYIIKKYGSK